MANKKSTQGDNHDVGVLDREKRKVRKPRKYKAVMHNDDYTPMDIVVLVLISVFRKPQAEAIKLMMDVHEKGRGIAGVYSKEICETKCEKATNVVRRLGFPFLVTPEPE